MAKPSVILTADWLSSAHVSQWTSLFTFSKICYMLIVNNLIKTTQCSLFCQNSFWLGLLGCRTPLSLAIIGAGGGFAFLFLIALILYKKLGWL